MSIFDILFSVTTLTDKSSLRMGDGQLKRLWQCLQVWAGIAVLFERRPAADKATRGVVDQTAARQEIELSQDLKTIANAEYVTAISHELLQPFTETVFGNELGDTATHDVIAIAEPTGEDNELGAFQRSGLQQRSGEKLGGKSSSLQGAGGLGITVGTGELDEQGVGHEWVRKGWLVGTVMQPYK